MFKISEFAQLGQVSIKTLRFYDQLDLLKPAHIDPTTGYRYYTAAQLLRLNRIMAFKELGFTLEQIVKLLDEKIPPEQIRGMFRLKQAEVQSLIENEQRRLMRIEGRLRQIEGEKQGLPLPEVVLKQVEPQLVVSIRQQTNSAFIPSILEELHEYLHYYAVSVTSPYLVIWHGCEECEDATDLEVACPISHNIPGSQSIQVYTLPAAPVMASIMHECQPRTVCSASVELADWIEANNYQMVPNQHRREVYLTSEDDGRYIAEVQIPVYRAAQ